jgi:hypothetical protein
MKSLQHYAILTACETMSSSELRDLATQVRNLASKRRNVEKWGQRYDAICQTPGDFVEELKTLNFTDMSFVVSGEIYWFTNLSQVRRCLDNSLMMQIHVNSLTLYVMENVPDRLTNFVSFLCRHSFFK